jgi:hypothetical protein
VAHGFSDELGSFGWIAIKTVREAEGEKFRGGQPTGERAFFLATIFFATIRDIAAQAPMGMLRKTLSAHFGLKPTRVGRRSDF